VVFENRYGVLVQNQQYPYCVGLIFKGGGKYRYPETSTADRNDAREKWWAEIVHRAMLKNILY